MGCLVGRREKREGTSLKEGKRISWKDGEEGEENGEKE